MVTKIDVAGGVRGNRKGNAIADGVSIGEIENPSRWGCTLHRVGSAF